MPSEEKLKRVSNNRHRIHKPSNANKPFTTTANNCTSFGPKNQCSKRPVRYVAHKVRKYATEANQKRRRNWKSNGTRTAEEVNTKVY